MKFAEHLQNSVVPEWKDKYIDYKMGKKKIKQLVGDDISLEDLINEFVEDWLISVELSKTNEFYQWLLKRCNDKYEVLEKQIGFYLWKLQMDENGYNSIGDDEELDMVISNGGLRLPVYDSVFQKTGEGTSVILEFLKSNNLLPCLPNKFNLKKNTITAFDKPQGSHHGRETFTQTDDVPSNRKAQSMLADAVLEFYLYLQLVKTYRDLNVTGFKKIVKKFDKTFQTEQLPLFMDYANDNYSMFKHVVDVENNSLHSYCLKATEWYTDDLTKDHGVLEKKAHNNRLKKLTTQYTLNEQMIHRNNRSTLQMFVSGIGIGVSFTLMLYTILKVLTSTTRDFVVTHKILFPLWGGWYMIHFMISLFILDCFIWHKTSINYKFIMFGDIHTKFGTQLFNNDFATSTIPLKLYFQVCFLVPCAILAFFSFYFDKLSPFAYLYLIWIGSLYFMPPTQLIPYWNKLLGTRKWLIVTSIHLIFSGFFPVQFADFFLGDVVSSLTYSLADIATFICVYTSPPNTNCGSSRLISMAVLACIPSYWRFMQCLRRYFDSDDWFPHLLNAGKYSMGIAYNVTLSAYRLSNHSMAKRGPFILFATINSIVTSIWDLVMDWSLLQNMSGKNRFLRDDLYLAGKKNWKTGEYSFARKLVYYFAMVLDVAIRFQWIVYAIAPQTIQQSALTSFILAFTEVIRRFVWVVFRVENEHVANVHLFKVSGDVPLPYPSYLVMSNNVTPRNSVVESYTTSWSPQGNELHEPSSTYHGLFRRRASLFENVSQAIPWAHATDYQRPASYPDHMIEPREESESESDSDCIESI